MASRRQEASYRLLLRLARLTGQSQSPAEQRRAIIRTLISPYSQEDCVFFPVFQQGESMAHIQNAMRELREQHPELITATWLIDDSERGLLAAEVEPDLLN
jgi:hypothetical protein